jgi:hypothetical protein
MATGSRLLLRTALLAPLFAMSLLSRPSYVAAECPFVPPWPRITTAIPSARVIVVGDVVSNFDPSDLHVADAASRTEALRVTAVLRGDVSVGDLVDEEWLLPNWPWGLPTAGWPAIPSCSYLQAVPGERIAIAFDALHPGGLMHDNGISWEQPPTRYNAMGVLIAKGASDGWGLERERVRLKQLERLAALPATDTASPPNPDRSQPLPWIPLIGGLVAGLAFLARGAGHRKTREH